MSYGLCCLTCRLYIGSEQNACQCTDPVPTWDLLTKADAEGRSFLYRKPEGEDE